MLESFAVRRRRAPLLAIALVAAVGAVACDEEADRRPVPGKGAKHAAAVTPPGQKAAGKKAPPKRPAAKKVAAKKVSPRGGAAAGLASWPAEVQRRYREIVRLKPAQRSQLARKVVKLARSGAAGRAAVRALADADKNSLPQAQRGIAAIAVAAVHRFDKAALIGLLSHHNPFVVRAAITALGRYGGPEVNRLLRTRAAKPGPHARAYRRAGSTRALALPDRANKMLHQLINATGQAKRSAAVVLAADYLPRAERDLLEVIKSPAADRDAQLYASFALCSANAANVAKLEAFAARKNNKYLRFSAMKKLAKLGKKGRAVLQRFLAQPGEPLKPRIREMLQKK